MDTKSFETLLTDLYDRYFPAGKAEISKLVEKYNGQEFDAVYHMLLKYNYSNHPKYEKDIEKPASVKNLIQQYSTGNYILRNIVASKISQEQVIDQKIEEANEKIKSTADQVSSEVKNQVQEFNSFIAEKKKEIEFLMQSIREQKEKPKVEDSNIEVKLNILWTGSEIILPKEVANFTKDTRFVCQDIKGELIGLEVKDVFWDFVSSPGKCIKDITIDKF